MSLTSNHSRHLLEKREILPWQKNNFLELDKTTLATWVDKALQQSLKNENIKSRFRVFGISPLSHVVVVGKFGPSDVFTTT
jgi:hypothetical protein